ncbi:glycosyltransferase [Candidatus Poribacteria bacterium]|nr:glycosyltransferase [Candidatus Poribacteria bacterium]
MRILMINYEFPPIGGGGGNVTYYISKHLAQVGHEIHVITSGFRDLPKYQKMDGFHVHRVPVIRKNPNVCGVHEMLTYVISASFYCLRFTREFKPDVIHVFFGIPSGPVAYILKKIYGFPYVVFLGGRDVPRPHPDPPFYRWMYGVLSPAIKSIWGNAKAVVACSDDLRDMALKTCENSRINVIPDGVDLSRFHPETKDDNPEKIRILAIGRLIPRKGFHLLIQSLPEVMKLTSRDFCVEIVGDGPMKTELLKLTKKLGLEDKVIFAGSVPYEKLDEKYRQAHIFVLSSLAEGMPLVVLEAMASGLPVVASRVQGIQQLVKEGVNGYLFSLGDYMSLGRKLTKAIDNNQRLGNMGMESTRIVKKYDWANIAEQYYNKYQQNE